MAISYHVEDGRVSYDEQGDEVPYGRIIVNCQSFEDAQRRASERATAEGYPHSATERGDSSDGGKDRPLLRRDEFGVSQK